MNILKMHNMHFTRNFFNNAIKAKENREKYLNMSFAEKRKLYSCRDKYVTLDKIPTWSDYFSKFKLDSKKSKQN